MAKHKLLAGLVLSGVAYAAYRTLDLEKREALKDEARDQYNALKDRAVDYAFYAADALDDFKESFNDHLAQKAAASDDYDDFDDHGVDNDNDDIVLSSDEVADATDEATADAADGASSVTPDAAADTPDDDESSVAK